MTDNTIDAYETLELLNKLPARHGPAALTSAERDSTQAFVDETTAEMHDALPTVETGEQHQQL